MWRHFCRLYMMGRKEEVQHEHESFCNIQPKKRQQNIKALTIYSNFKTIKVESISCLSAATEIKTDRKREQIAAWQNTFFRGEGIKQPYATAFIFPCCDYTEGGFSWGQRRINKAAPSPGSPVKPHLSLHVEGALTARLISHSPMSPSK